VVTAILRLPAVKARTGLSRSTIYLRISEGSFPKPVSLGGRAVGWIDSEVDAWLADRVAESRDATAHPGGANPMEWKSTARVAGRRDPAKTCPSAANGAGGTKESKCERPGDRGPASNR